MNKDYTHIAMIIDRSGSMSPCWKDVCGGYEEIVKTNKEAPGKCTFTVAAFDTHYDLLEDFTDIKDVKEQLTVNPRGGTALLDAVGKTIVSVGEKLAALPEAERPMKVCIIIQTDGEENSSVEFTKDAIKKMIDEQTNTYQWQFQFLGASLDSVQDAVSWGIHLSNTSTYNTSNSDVTFKVMGEKMTRMRSADSMAMYAASVAWTDEEKEILNQDVEKI
jgi:hypothetical protein